MVTVNVGPSYSIISLARSSIFNNQLGTAKLCNKAKVRLDWLSAARFSSGLRRTALEGHGLRNNHDARYEQLRHEVAQP